MRLTVLLTAWWCNSNRIGLSKKREMKIILEMIDLINEIVLIQDEENGILSDDSLEFWFYIMNKENFL